MSWQRRHDLDDPAAIYERKEQREIAEQERQLIRFLRKAKMERVFNTPYEALCFAYRNFDGSVDRPMSAKMAGTLSGGDGLVGMDAAGQAGLIRSALHRQISRLHEAIIIAKFAPAKLSCECGRLCCSGTKPNLEWMAAIRVISDAAVGTALTGHLTVRYLRDVIVGRYFGVTTVSLADAASKAGVHANTATDHNGKVKLWLKGERGGKKGEEARATEAALSALSGWFERAA